MGKEVVKNLVYIPDHIVRKYLSIEESIKVVEKVYESHGKGEAYLSDPPALSLHSESNKLSSYKIKGAMIPSMGVSGFRLLGNAPARGTEEGKQTYGYCYLTDPVTSIPIALIHEYYQHILRTGVTAAVALYHLGKKDSKILGIIGAGKIARIALEAVSKLFPITEVKVNSRRKESRERFAYEMSDKLNINIGSVGNPELAVTGSDLVITITTADEALVAPGWLDDGVTLCSLGGSQELDPKILGEIDKLVVDDFEFCTMAGDIHAWINKGYLTRTEVEKRLYGSIGEIIAGVKAGRQKKDEKILTIIQGMASCDLAIAKLVYDRLKDSHEIQRINIREEVK